jgi:putative SOS response-associated peptidase YedK
VPSAAIITFPPNDLVAELHDPMPVILPPKA